jgi:hypothetical protein
MSLLNDERECIGRLADMYQAGTTLTTCDVMFKGIQLDGQQKNAICKRLEENRLIKATRQLGQLLPYQIEIEPKILDELPGIQVDSYRDPVTGFESRSIILPVGPYDPPKSPDAVEQPRDLWSMVCYLAKLWFGDPAIRFAMFFAVSGVALIAAPWWQPILQEAAIKQFGLSESAFSGTEKGLFWSGWILITVAIALYVWQKRQATANR